MRHFLYASITCLDAEEGTRTAGARLEGRTAPNAAHLARSSALQARRVALAGVFLPMLAEAAVGGFLVWVGAEFVDIDVDAETGDGRQIDPAVLHIQ